MLDEDTRAPWPAADTRFRRARRRPPPDDPQVVEVAYLVIVLRVGDGGAQHLLDEPGRRTRGELERGQGIADRLAANVIEDQARLAR